MVFVSSESEKLQLLMIVSGYYDDSENFKVSEEHNVICLHNKKCMVFVIANANIHFTSEGDLSLCQNCRAYEKLPSFF